MMNTETAHEKESENYVISSWEDERLNLHTSLLRGIYAFGFEKPSPIQCKALGPMTSSNNRDIIGISKTRDSTIC